MSYTKITFENMLKSVNKIQETTLTDIDLTDILIYLDVFIDIQEDIMSKDSEIGKLWNEILFDLIASINSATSGFYRSAIITLRSILEIGCYSIYYYDHKIEYKIFQNEDTKADKYVSTLVNNYEFFKSKYIRTFYPNIDNIEKKQDSISLYLNQTYAALSDVVHGRYKSLIKVDRLNIQYNKADFKRYEKLLFSTLSILSVLYILRFCNCNTDSEELKRLIKVSGVINNE